MKKDKFFKRKIIFLCFRKTLYVSHKSIYLLFNHCGFAVQLFSLSATNIVGLLFSANRCFVLCQKSILAQCKSQVYVQTRTTNFSHLNKKAKIEKIAIFRQRKEVSKLFKSFWE